MRRRRRARRSGHSDRAYRRAIASAERLVGGADELGDFEGPDALVRAIKSARAANNGPISIADVRLWIAARTSSSAKATACMRATTGRGALEQRASR